MAARRKVASAGLRLPDLWTVLTLAALAVLAIFVLWPLANVFTASFYGEFSGSLGLENYATFFGSGYFRRALWHSLFTSAMGTLLALALGLPLAVIAARYDFVGKAALRVLVLLSLISPPFIGAYAWIMLLGRQGLVTQALAGIGIGLPTIYGAPGIILVTALNLYPLVFLLVHGALLRIDRSLEEASLGLGRTRFQTFRSITLPLTLPAMATGALLVFLGVLSDFGTPALLGENYPVLATLAFTLFLSEIGGNPAMASTTSVVLVTVALVLILLQRWVASRRNYATDAINRPEILRMAGWQRFAFPAFAWGLMAIANLPLVIIVYTSFLETSGPVFLQSFSLDSYRQVFHLVRGAIVNSFAFSGMALALIVVTGSVVGYIISRRDTMLIRVLDTALMIPYVIPGTVLGIGFITAFNQPPIWITGTVAIIVAAYFIRRLPYMVRACASYVYQIDRSVEEASINLGAPPGKTFMKIMLPLMAPGILAGAVLAWVEVINELSATVVLYTGTTSTMPIATYSQVLAGSYGPAAAVASLLILATTLSLVLFTVIGGSDRELTV
jgi:iron(III) transport system permease protein